MDTTDLRRLPLVKWNPHPLTEQGEKISKVTSGMSLLSVVRIFLVDENNPHTCRLNGNKVLREDYADISLKPGDIVYLRAMGAGGDDSGSNPLAVIASIAVLVAAPFLAAKFAPSLSQSLLGRAASTAFTNALTAGIGFAGILIVNALFPPRLPKLNYGGSGDRADAPDQFSISGGANSARPYEPLILILGKHRVFPDYAAASYTEYDSAGDQFLYQLFDFGIGSNLTLSEEQIGETDIDEFDSVTKGYKRPNLVAGNVDTIEGGELGEDVSSISKTTSGDVVRIGFDLLAQHFRATDRGKLQGRDTQFRLQWRKTGTTSYTSRDVTLTTPSGAEARNAVRRTYAYDVSKGAYDVRVVLRTSVDEDDDRLTFAASVANIKAYQNQTADFSGRNPYAMVIKATGQLYGQVQSFNAVASQKIPDWDRTNKVWTAAKDTSNPAAILRKYLLGWRTGERLIAGMGLSESRIDMDSIQLWHEFCDDNDLECNLVINDGRDHNAMLTLICQCGWGSIDQQTGKWGVLWEDANVPVTAIINPANIIKGSLNVTYDNENLADEMIGTFIDKASDYETNELRRTVPGVTHPSKPVEVSLEGITGGVQAAKEINRAVAAQAYHIRTIVWEMDLEEAMSIARGDVIGAAHGLLGQGRGGRFLKWQGSNLSGTAPAESSSERGTIWIWDLNDKVVSKSYTSNDDLDYVVFGLSGPPDGVEDDPLSYRYMAFPTGTNINLAKLRVTGKEPSGERRIRFVARDEVDDYYSHRTANLRWSPIAIDRLNTRLSRLEPVPSLSVTFSADGTRIFTWSLHPSERVTGYQLRWGETDDDWDAMKPLHEGIVSSSPLQHDELPPEGQYKIAIAGITGDGRRTTVRYLTKTFLNPFIGQQKWLSGAADPVDSIGEDGDYYLNTTSAEVFSKISGKWVGQVNLKGADGQAGGVWYTGSGVPKNSLGSDGDWYFRTGTGVVAGSIWQKASGSWSQVIDIDNGIDGQPGTDGLDGKPGSEWHSGPGVPSNDLGKIGDFYFQTSNGYVYEKVL